MVWISTKGTVVTFTVLHVWCFQCCADIRWHQTRPMFRQCNGYIRQCFKDLVDAPDRVSSPNTREVFFSRCQKWISKSQNTAANMFFIFWGLKVSVLECSSILPAKTFPQCTIILLAAPLSFFCPITGYAVVVFCNVAVRNKTARALHPLGIPYFWGKDSNLKKSHRFKT